jgi:hypothetical protein
VCIPGPRKEHGKRKKRERKEKARHEKTKQRKEDGGVAVGHN